MKILHKESKKVMEKYQLVKHGPQLSKIVASIHLVRLEWSQVLW